MAQSRAKEKKIIWKSLTTRSQVSIEEQNRRWENDLDEWNLPSYQRFDLEPEGGTILVIKTNREIFKTPGAKESTAA